MPQMPEEFENIPSNIAKKVAKKKAQTATAEFQRSNYEGKAFNALNELRENNRLILESTDAKVKAKLNKSVIVLQTRISRFQSLIQKFEEKRFLYAQELLVLLRTI